VHNEGHCIGRVSAFWAFCSNLGTPNSRIWNSETQAAGHRSGRPFMGLNHRGGGAQSGRRCGRDSTIEPTVHHVVSSGQSPRCERRGRGGDQPLFLEEMVSPSKSLFRHLSDARHPSAKQPSVNYTPPNCARNQQLYGAKKGTKIIWAPTCRSEVLLLMRSHYIWGFTLRSTRVKFG